jgi:hypothetical protein
VQENFWKQGGDRLGSKGFNLDVTSFRKPSQTTKSKEYSESSPGLGTSNADSRALPQNSGAGTLQP